MEPGNAAFDADLRDRDPAWDLCGVEAVAALAAGGRFGPLTAMPMPVNNLMPLFRRLDRNDVSS